MGKNNLQLFTLFTSKFKLQTDHTPFPSISDPVCTLFSLPETIEVKKTLENEKSLQVTDHFFFFLLKQNAEGATEIARLVCWFSNTQVRFFCFIDFESDKAIKI